MFKKPVRNAEHTFGSGHHINSPIQVLLVALALAGTYLYARFMFNPGNAGNALPYILALTAETFIMWQSAMALWTILVGGYNPRNFDYYYAQEELFAPELRQRVSRFIARDIKAVDEMVRRAPMFLNKRRARIDVYITVYGEPLEIIAQTARAARDLIGDHQTYILDDGKSNAVRELAAKLGIGYLRRPNNEGAKAGNLNHALRQTRGDFIVIFDADFVAKQSFLYETVPFFSDPQVAFVQTPQHYRNLDTVISRGAGYMQRVFYRLIQPGKNRFNAAFFVGTNAMFRREHLQSIGGFYQKSNSEDIWTSLLLHERGYRSVFIPDILAVGTTPDTIKAYVKQQLRWATGGMEIFFTHNPLFARLTVDQRIQYFTTSAYYLLGVAIAFLMILPPLQIFFNLTPVNLSVTFATWLFFYLAFYAMQIVVAFYTMEGFMVETLLLATISFPIYVRALVNVIFGRKEKWNVTGKRDFDSPYNYIMPQILIFLFLTFTTVMGVLKGFATGSFSLSIFWNSINMVIFGCFLLAARREHRALKRAFVREQAVVKTRIQEGVAA